MKIIKDISMGVIFLIILVLTLININKQFSILKEARVKNMELSEEYFVLEKRRSNLIAFIEHATSSAYIEQQARDKLGLGGDNDFWIIGQMEMDKIDLYPQINEEKNKSNWNLWVEWFTK